MGFAEVRIKASPASGKVPETMRCEFAHGFPAGKAQNIPGIWVKSRILVFVGFHLKISFLKNYFLRSAQGLVHG